MYTVKNTKRGERDKSISIPSEIKNFRAALHRPQSDLQRENARLRAAQLPFAEAQGSREPRITSAVLRRAKATLAAVAPRVLARAGAKEPQ